MLYVFLTSGFMLASNISLNYELWSSIILLLNTINKLLKAIRVDLLHEIFVNT